MAKRKSGLCGEKNYEKKWQRKKSRKSLQEKEKRGRLLISTKGRPFKLGEKFLRRNRTILSRGDRRKGGVLGNASRDGGGERREACLFHRKRRKEKSGKEEKKKTHI